jgi:hypothetical protein
MPIVDLDGDGRHAGQFIRDAERPKANQPRTINRQKKQKRNAMKPATPQTEKTPSTEPRKTVFGGSP